VRVHVLSNINKNYIHEEVEWMFGSRERVLLFCSEYFISWFVLRCFPGGTSENNENIPSC